MSRRAEIYGHMTTLGVGKITVLLRSHCYFCNFHASTEEIPGVSDIMKIFPITKQAVN
jgi:hypothetical protein